MSEGMWIVLVERTRKGKTQRVSTTSPMTLVEAARHIGDLRAEYLATGQVDMSATMFPAAPIVVSVSERSIELAQGFPDKPTPVEVDRAMAEVSAALGVKYGAVFMAGSWVIGRTEPEWVPTFGGAGQPRSRVFATALANGIGRAVVQAIPFCACPGSYLARGRHMAGCELAGGKR